MNYSKIIRSLAVAALCGLTTPALLADTVTGRIVNSAGVGIAGVELDFSGGVNPINPFTDVNGFFNVTVPPGTYDIGFLPPTAGLAPLELLNVAVFGTKNLGTMTMPVGYILSGRVTTTSGQAVSGGNMNVYDEATGQKLLTPGDGTDPLGNFAVTVPAGLFRVEARPPSATLLVPAELENVAVTGATNVGTMQLSPGVVVTGTLIDSIGGLPLVNVDIDVDDAQTGKRVITPNDNTNGAGVFSVIVPARLSHFSFRPPAGMPNVARQLFNVPIPGSTNLGTTALQRGSFLSGTVRGPGGVAVAGADIDVDTSLGGVRIYTPNDNTNSTGQFQVVVPNGNYRVTVEPTFASGLVGARTGAVQVSGNTAIPQINLAAGIVLSGTVTGWNGRPESAADIDVLDPVTGVEVVTPGDNTDQNGNYAVLVPAGTWDVRFQTRKASLSRNQLVENVAIAGPTNLARSLEMTPVRCLLAVPGIPTVPGDSLLLTSMAFQNPTATTQSSRVSLVLRAPDGSETFLWKPFQVALPAGSFGGAVGRGLTATLAGAPTTTSELADLSLEMLPLQVPVALPRVPAALSGQPFRIELRFDDPADGTEQDRDSITVIIQ